MNELEEALRVIARRAESGSVPGTELARLALEVELARSRLSSDTSDALAARIELATMVGADTPPERLDGSLEAQTPPPSIVERALAEHPAVLEAREAEEAARSASGAADLAWIPDITLSAGVDFEGAGNLRTGYVAGVSIDLPFGDNGQGLRAGARARRELADAIERSLRASIAARVRGAHAPIEAALAELGRFEAATSESAALLQRGTRAAYTEGRVSLYELLDAQRAAYEVAARRVELALEAKCAEVVLRATAGEI